VNNTTETRKPMIPAVGPVTPDNHPRLSDLDNPDALHPAPIGVFCDDCDTEHVADYLVPADSTSAQRFEVARKHLRTLGWSCIPASDLCPDCAKANDR
jgi:hypothetical protein